MSHVSEIAVEVNDLAALVKAAPLCGLEVVEKTTYRWYGKHVGDYPLPAGFTEEDLGKCEFALSVRGNDKAYEVGVCKRRDGKPGFVLLQDFWNGGFGLEAAIGKDGSKLVQEYSIQVATKTLARQGFRTQRVINPNTNRAQLKAWRS